MIIVTDIFLKEVPVWTLILAFVPVVWRLIVSYFVIQNHEKQIESLKVAITEIKMKEELNNSEMIKSIQDLHKIIIELRTEMRIRNELPR